MFLNKVNVLNKFKPSVGSHMAHRTGAKHVIITHDTVEQLQLNNTA